jgi:hypothetical protein
MKSLIEVPRKAQGTSVLKNLPAKRQAALLDYYETHKGTDTVKWLAKNSIKTSAPSLSAWRSWYLEKKIFDLRGTIILEQLLEYKRSHPEFTREVLDELGEFLFNALAIVHKDVKTWTLAQQVELKHERKVQQKEIVVIAARKQGLEVRKYRDQKAKTPKVIHDIGLTPEEKRLRMKEILHIN